MAKGEDITTRFKIDVSDLKKGISQAEQSIKVANAQFKKASAGMDDWRKSSEGIRAKLTQLGDVLNAQKSKVAAYQEELKRNKDAYEENGRRAAELRQKLAELAANGVDKASAEYKKYENELAAVENEQSKNEKAVDRLKVTLLNQEAAVVKTEKEINDYNKSLDSLEKEEKQADDAAEDLTKSTKEAGDASNKAKEGFTVMKGVLADLAATAIKACVSALKDFASSTIEVGKAFDTSMSNVGAISNATADEMSALEEKAKELGASTKFTASEVADGFGYMAMAGWKTEEMVNGIDGVLQLAAASGSDLATASDIVTDALTAMGYSAQDAGRLANVMAAASSNANTNVELMGGTFQYAAPIAGALGYSMEDTAVAIGLMANAGIKGQKAGTALRSMFSSMAAPTKEAASAMAELGIEVKNEDGSMKPLNETLGDLRTAFSQLSESEQTQMAKAIAGKSAMTGMLAIVNASEADFNKLTAAVESSNDGMGAAAEMSEKMMDNLGGDMTKLGSAAEGLQLALYDTAEGGMRSIVQTITNDLLPSITDLAKGVEGSGTAVGEAVSKLLNTIVDEVVDFAPELLNMALTLVESVAQGILDALPKLMTTLTSFIQQNLPQVIETVLSLATQLINQLSVILPDLLVMIANLLPQIVTTIINAVPQLLQAGIRLFMGLVDALPQILNSLIAAIPVILNAVVDFIANGGFTMLLNGAIQGFMALVDAIPKILPALYAAAPQIIDAIISVILTLTPQLLSAAIQLFGAFVTAIPTLIASLSQELPKVLETIINAFKDIPSRVGKIFQKAWQSIKKAFSQVGSFFKKQWQKIKDAFGNVASWFGKVFKKAWNNIKNAFSSIGSWFSEKWNAIKRVFQLVPVWFRDRFGEAIRNIKHAFSGIVEFFSGIWTSIKTTFTDVGTKIGNAIGGAVKKAINSVIATVEGAINGAIRLINGAIDLINKLPGVSVSHVNTVSLPRLAKGGVLEKGQVGLLEGSGAEAVVPLEKNKKWISAVANDLLTTLGTNGSINNNNLSKDYNFTQNIYSPKAPSRLEIYKQTKNLLRYARSM